ncbi:hypothetical protein GCM10025768_08120 [Microbacterium pseudoresistens]|uniref:Catechol 2,3-dioxygenase-like lactoylglutathione lyase family enzyme n=1 Tax=Microbacterium pseudoresistens TaxID=640634 RepID=A0A7Y9EVH1_9MICO|nr:glyoxalase [Microbacterium pseudoresistens]NYD54648.1 catechol 2,3-dioxygenase-like lactoylglutathione lyase family enzyme [Microbacterium pseudoresistens]
MNTTIDAITLETTDLAAAKAFYDAVFGLRDRIRLRETAEPSEGFRGYTLSLIVAQPADALLLFDDATAAGAVVRKPPTKSLWGFGGALEAPDGALWNIATSSKKDTAPASRAIESVVLLLGSADVRRSRAFYTERGFAVRKSFGSYVDFDTPAGTIGLGLYKRAALAKSVDVSAEGSGSHRIVIHGGADAVDPDGFVWEA